MFHWASAPSRDSRAQERPHKRPHEGTSPPQGYSCKFIYFNVLGVESTVFAASLSRSSEFCQSFPHGFIPRGRNRGYLLLLGAHLIASAVRLGPLLLPRGVLGGSCSGVGIGKDSTERSKGFGSTGRDRGHLLLLGARPIASAVGLGPLLLPRWGTSNFGYF